MKRKQKRLRLSYRLAALKRSLQHSFRTRHREKIGKLSSYQMTSIRERNIGSKAPFFPTETKITSSDEMNHNTDLSTGIFLDDKRIKRSSSSKVKGNRIQTIRERILRRKKGRTNTSSTSSISSYQREEFIENFARQNGSLPEIPLSSSTRRVELTSALSASFSKTSESSRTYRERRMLNRIRRKDKKKVTGIIILRA